MYFRWSQMSPCTGWKGIIERSKWPLDDMKGHRALQEQECSCPWIKTQDFRAVPRLNLTTNYRGVGAGKILVKDGFAEVPSGWYQARSQYFSQVAGSRKNAPQPYAADRGSGGSGFSENHILSSVHLFCSRGRGMAPVPPFLGYIPGSNDRRHIYLHLRELSK